MVDKKTEHKSPGLKVGERFKTNKHGWVTVESYGGYDKVGIVFDDTGYAMNSTTGNIKKGCPVDLLVPSFFGLGYLGGTKHRAMVDNKVTWEFSRWQNMLKRVYPPYWEGPHKSYRGCTVSSNFCNFQYFAEWCKIQTGYGEVRWHLDKDILVEGNRLYSEDTCCFVPAEINMLFPNTRARGYNLPIGVDISGWDGQFLASISIGGKQKHLGGFPTAELASDAYQKERAVLIRELTEYWKGYISLDVYNALKGKI